MDIDQIRELVQLMVDNDLSRIEIHDGQTHVLLRRGQAVIAAGPVAGGGLAPMAPVAGPAAGAIAGAAEAGVAGAGAGELEASQEILIRSPMVGTFYAAPDPESSPYVKVGDPVEPETVVCLVEAMKVFNEIKAEVSGRIAKVFVKSGEAVEFDQPLFAVIPA